MSKSGQKRISILIFTDVGEEIDDEIALFWFLNFVYDVTKHDVTIVFTEGVVGASITPVGRYEIFRKYFPHAPKSIHYIYELVELRKITGRVYDKMLQIAPLRGVPVDFLAQNTIKIIYLMGQRKPYPGSINTYKSFVKNRKAMNEYREQLKHLEDVETVSISTEICRKVPLTSKLVQKLPEEFCSQIFEKAYEQFVGRVEAHLPYCYEVTFQVNYKTIMRYVEGNNHFQNYQDEYWHSLRLSRLAEHFYESIVVKPSQANSDLDQNKLKQMILVVEFLTEGYYRDSTLQNGPKYFAMYHRNFEGWKERTINSGCPLTPAYDLLAMVAMVKEINEEDLSSSDPAQLSKMVEHEFR